MRCRRTSTISKTPVSRSAASPISEPANYTNARYLVRRLRKRFGAMQPMLGFWGFTHDDSRYLDAIEATECDVVVTSLREAVERIVSFAIRKPSAAKSRDEMVA